MKIQKSSSNQDELAKSMEAYLSNKKEPSGVADVAKAIEQINSAAEMFESVGYSTAAEELTRFLESFANRNK